MRDIKGLIMEIFLPIVIVILGLALLTKFAAFEDQESVKEKISNYDTPQSVVYNTRLMYDPPDLEENEELK